MISKSKAFINMVVALFIDGLETGDKIRPAEPPAFREALAE